jgi:hypothetical protein
MVRPVGVTIVPCSLGVAAGVNWRYDRRTGGTGDLCGASRLRKMKVLPFGAVTTCGLLAGVLKRIVPLLRLLATSCDAVAGVTRVGTPGTPARETKIFLYNVKKVKKLT